MRTVLLTLLVVAAAGCTRGGGGEVSVHLGVADGWAGPALRDFGRDHGTTVGRVRDAAQADVLWERDLEPILQLAAGGKLAPVDASSADRITAMVGGQDQWIGLSGIARVILYDPEKIPEADAPTHLLDVAKPENARRLAIADPTRGSAAWSAAALAETVGEARALQFYNALGEHGAQIFDDEEQVVSAVISGERSLAITDSDYALASQEHQPRLVVLVPDQDADSIGTLLLPVALALTKQGAQNAQARALIAHLLSAPTTLSLTLSGNQVLVLRDTNAPAGMLRASDLRTMQVSFTTLAEKLPALRSKLATLRSPV